MDPDSAAARLFVALEDWLNDGVPLSGATARECLRQWYRDNLPMRGEWRVSGLRVDPPTITVPAFVAVPRRDRIVPPKSARALARLLPNVTLVEPDAGPCRDDRPAAARAALLWEPLRAWLKATAVMAEAPPNPRRDRTAKAETAVGGGLGVRPKRARRSSCRESWAARPWPGRDGLARSRVRTATAGCIDIDQCGPGEKR